MKPACHCLLGLPLLLIAATAVHAGCYAPGGVAPMFVVKLDADGLRKNTDAVLHRNGLHLQRTLVDETLLMATADGEDDVRRLLELDRLPKGIVELEPVPALPIDAEIGAVRLLEPKKLLPGQPPPEQWYRGKIGIEIAQARVAQLAVAADRYLIAAIIDTGADLTHPALRARAWHDPDSSRVVNGMDFTAAEPSTRLTDLSRDGHGTHVTGIIFGEAVGETTLKPLAPDARFITLPIGHGYCIESAIAAKAIGYAARKRAAVANLSWKGQPDESLRASMEQAGQMLFVVAIANDNENVDTNRSYPVWFDLPNVITVTESGENDAAPARKGRRIDIAAPGEAILSTLPRGNFGTMNGTSAAAPMVTATALLLKSLAPQWTPLQLKRYLIDSADMPNNKWDKRGYGRLDAERATAAPIIITWPRQDAGTDIHVDSNGGRLPVKWRARFATRECPYLEAELRIGDGGYRPARAAVEPVPTSANRADILVEAGFRQEKVRVRLRCKGTSLVAESDEFSAKDFADY